MTVSFYSYDLILLQDTEDYHKFDSENSTLSEHLNLPSVVSLPRGPCLAASRRRGIQSLRPQFFELHYPTPRSLQRGHVGASPGEAPKSTSSCVEEGLV